MVALENGIIRKFNASSGHELFSYDLKLRGSPSDFGTTNSKDLVAIHGLQISRFSSPQLV